MSTSSSSSSSSSTEDVEGRDGGAGGSGVAGAGAGAGGYEGPSTSRSRRRFGNQVWPAPFIEALATQVAIDASRSFGRLAAAAALFNLIQVCSTWRAVSRSDLLWQNLTRRIWNREQPLEDTWSWRQEFIYRHRTANNFRLHRYVYTPIQFPPADHNDNNNNEVVTCLRLALSDHYLAAGFSNGMVHLFHLDTRLHLSTFHPEPRDRLGRFPSAVTGIILSDTQLVFASLDGDIHVVVINPPNPPRRAHSGNVVNDGALVDFTGCRQWWVGLYAGAPGRAFHVWNSETEEVVFIGGTLTDPESLMGWHLLDQLTEFIGRVRVASHETAMACTSIRVIVFDLQNQGIVLGEEEFQRGLIVGCVDASYESFLVIDTRGLASIRRVGTLDEICRFRVMGAGQRGVLGCMNGGYALICIAGIIRVWNTENGVYLYSFRERIGEANALIADERNVVAACSSDSTIHLWDFGAQ